MSLAIKTDSDPRWISEGLENLESCPACGSVNRRPLFSELTDGVYGAAGLWTLWKCETCEVAYLNPRPSPEGIWRAYEGYYTHIPVPKRSFRNRIRDLVAQWIRNDYLNHHSGYSLRPNIPFLGSRLIKSIPGRAVAIQYHIRHLPPPSEPGARLLDIGAGCGAFLLVAKGLGYSAEGLEPDPDAAAACRSSGFDVRAGSFPQTALPENAYEHVVLSHVIEHLHHPVEAIKEIRKALKPGGRVWMATPNLDSSGLRRWGRNWRGLEPPRHLVLYNAASIAGLLKRMGFQRIEILDPEAVRHYIYPASSKIEKGELFNPAEGVHTSEEIDRLVEADNQVERRNPLTSEYLALTAYK
jgi:2-polyprenyl-3-methyl-5-hydroxy-6-metoxy-1,4-benzoquinol methylase